MHQVPDKNPGSDSDTVCLKRDRFRTCHESDPIYIVSCSDTSCWLLEESRDRVGRSLEPDPTRTSSHPAPTSPTSSAGRGTWVTWRAAASTTRLLSDKKGIPKIAWCDSSGVTLKRVGLGAVKFAAGMDTLANSSSESLTGASDNG